MASLHVLLFVTLSAETDLDRQFTQNVRPFLNRYCVSCHTGAQAAAQFDLTQYGNAASTVRDHSRWALVAEKLRGGEMPPKGLKQPTDAERQFLVHWVEEMRAAEARKNAGDPGVVLVRRLSNAEYNNSIRDLTGVDLKPAREFPLDPSNTAGFDNSGESLTMSPSLLNKYLQAARDISTHLVLKPVGFTFAPHPMLVETDREKYTIHRIVDFYDRQPTDYAAYFEAAWRYKHRTDRALTLEHFAKEAKLSAKYLPMVWGILEEAKHDAGPVARLQTMWRMLPKPEHKQPDLVKESCLKMRDYVTRIRKLTAMQFRSPKVTGLGGTSQPLMNHKLRAYAANRRNFDRTALQVEGEAPMQIPAMVRSGGVPSEDQVALRNAALAARLRAGDPDLLVPAGQRAAYEASFAAFANVFPDAFYIRERGRFYPDDSEDKGRLLSAGFHNVMGYMRDDTPLMELILDEPGQKELDKLWLEFDTIADQTTRTYVQFFFNQSGEIEGRGRESGSFRPGDKEFTSEKVIYGIRDTYLAKDPKADSVALEAIREHFARVNTRIRLVEKTRIEAEPSHLESLLDFAGRAYRRPLQPAEKDDLLAYYRSLREKSGLPHDEAMRDMIVLVLMSPDFCYRVDLPQAPANAPKVLTKGKPVAKPRPVAATVEKVRPLSDHALASRLSYLIWSSMPDAELMEHANKGDLHQPAVLAAQIQRMLKDKRSVALATEFAGNWLDYRRFETINSVDRTRFPEFTNALRQAMFEEPVRFIDDLIRRGQSMLEVIYGTHTFVNRDLARHYGMNENFRIRTGEWIRVDDARRWGRGGLLPMAAFLTKNSPGLRTSPVKRGYWIAKTLLGEPIPPPPPAVPELPGDESKMELTLRQMLAKHREHASCSGCHQRFDGLGLPFEGYGPVGEQRTRDLAGRPVDITAEFPGGTQGKGIDALVDYIRKNRERDYVNNLVRKFSVYALNRGLQLSDEPLVEEARAAFSAGGYRFAALIESIVTSQQFLNQRNPEAQPLTRK